MSGALSGLEGQLEQAAEEQYTSFVKREPAVLTGILGGPILGLVTLLAPGQADKLASQITAAVVAVLVALTGFLVRRFVAPAWKTRTGRDLPETGLVDALEDKPPAKLDATPVTVVGGSGYYGRPGHTAGNARGYYGGRGQGATNDIRGR